MDNSRSFSRRKYIEIPILMIFRPDRNVLFKAMSLTLWSIMQEEQEDNGFERTVGSSDEAREASIPPTDVEIEEFVTFLFDQASFDLECCIISLIYINRMEFFKQMHKTKTTKVNYLDGTNWRQFLLAAFVIAQKVWDSESFSDANIAFFEDQDIQGFETALLEGINYQLTFKGALYAKYYFELRSNCNQDFPLKPLDSSHVALLEQKSRDAQLKMMPGQSKLRAKE